MPEGARRAGVGAGCYRWSVTLRNLMLYPGMSRGGVVHVLNGECYAARTDVARALLDDFTGQTFMGRRFDSGGAYVRRWVPELTGLSDERIHTPWEVDDSELERAGVRLGQTYPRPMVDHAAARARALAAFATLKKSGD